MNSKILSIAIILPVVVLAGWFVSLEIAKNSGQIVRLAVTGYDPRDLLAGHFLNFQIARTAVNPCESYKTYGQPKACACFRADVSGNSTMPAISELYWGGDCDEMPNDCQVFMRGKCLRDSFDSGINRYYFPEEFAGVLKVVPPNSSITLSLDGNGNSQLRQFFVADQTLEQYARDTIASNKQ